MEGIGTIWHMKTWYIFSQLKQFSTCYNSKFPNISRGKRFNSFCKQDIIIFWEILEQFVTWKLDIVQNLCEFCQLFLFDIWGQNAPKPKMGPRRKSVLIPSSPKIPQGGICPNTLNFCTTHFALR